MGQSTSNLLDPNVQSKSSATHAHRHTRQRHTHEVAHSKRSIVSSSKDEQFENYSRSPRTRTSIHHDHGRRGRRSRGQLEQDSIPLIEVDGNGRRGIDSDPATSQEQKRQTPHTKPRDPKPRNDESASNPPRIRNPNRKTENQRRGRKKENEKTRPHTHSPPSTHHRASQAKSKAKVKTTEPNQTKSKPQHDLKPAKKETKDCIICVETRSIDRFPSRAPTAKCEHEVNTCRHCLRGWIRSEAKSNVWNQLDCPECRARMEYEDVKAFAPVEVFRRYDRLSTKAALEAIPGFRWCIAKGCASGQVHDEGDVTPKFRCAACRKSHCIVHQVVWHKGETCAQYDYRTDNKIKKAEESASKKLIKELAKKCPGCKWNIEKNDGCDHMTCSKCRHEFCWLCLAPWGPIRDQGAQLHRPTCGLHSA